MKSLKLAGLLIFIFFYNSMHSQCVQEIEKKLVENILNRYDGLEVLLCKESLSYDTEIVSYNRTLRESMDIPFIEKMQKYSPPKDDKPIGDFINANDFRFMASTISEVKWKKKNTKLIEVDFCNETEINSFDKNVIRISKPLFTENQKYAIIFVSESTPEYSVYLKVFEGGKDQWKQIINLNL